ncbi:GNAT family N-acetyltransferase [Thiofilum flexile]|uniref:GNAT family N-acetyltransferase n=1 Tax=Thiofilum flexile TaxID=125627 RepID=UPI00036F2E32|nr:GNAT family N-acetyltransferase [Thiofilum flexile]
MTITVKITPTVDYDFALALTYSNMHYYYEKHQIGWETPCFLKNWQKSENFGIHHQQQCIGVIRLEEDDRTCYLADLQLLPDLQGQGIGSYVLHYMKQLAQIRKKQLMSLLVFVDNPAMNLYRRHGFEVTEKTEVLARMECPLN